MKEIFFALFLSALIFSNISVFGQTWNVGGNALAALGRIGATTNRPVVFITNNQERGRVDSNGNWGFGSPSSSDKVRINTPAGSIPLRAMVNGQTALLVHSGGGISIGSNTTPPANGLYVSGNTGIGIASPLGKLHVNSAAGAEAFRADVNGSTKLLVHSAGGVSIGSNTTPPANGLYVSGNTGIGTASPLGKLHVNSAVGAEAFRADVNGSTKLLVHSGGGVSIGSNIIPPANGLYVSGKTGIGTSAPENTLHVFKGSAGNVTGWETAPLIVENSQESYINLLAPSQYATGVLFGDPNLGTTSGSIVYNSTYTPRGFEFSANNLTNQMVLTNSGDLGIGTSEPANKLHVFKGSAGAVTGYVDAPLIVENSVSSYVNILAPSESETGVLFGNPESNVSAGIIYNNATTPRGLQFRIHDNYTPMVLSETGGLGIGTLDPGGCRLKIKNDHQNAGLGLESIFGGRVWTLYSQNFASLSLYYNGYEKGQFSGVSGDYYSTSDERLKTNIKPMTTMLDKISQLKPSTYQFKDTTDKQEYNGFIAQDVMKIFPSMVMHNVIPERKVDVYTMNYSGFGVIAVKGIQELQPMIEEQKKINEEQKVKILVLEDRVAKLEAVLADVIAGKGLQNSAAVKGASLEQNQPNPFNESTIIRYRLPQGSKGQIKIFNQTGSLVKTLVANESGQSKLNAYDLTAGTYTYTLMVDGKTVGSKTLIILK